MQSHGLLKKFQSLVGLSKEIVKLLDYSIGRKTI